MFTLPIGFIGVLLAIILSTDSSKWGLYLNAHAITIVVGGTIGILFYLAPASVLKELVHGFKRMVSPEEKFSDLEKEFRALARKEVPSEKSRNQLISYARDMWDPGIDPDLFIVLVSQKRNELENLGIEAVQTLRNLAKYPPALGMVGTVMGLVQLFSALGSDTSSIGAALALAMTATFFGLFVANVLVNPLADRLHVTFMRRKALLTSIYEVLILINHGEDASIVEDEVKLRGAA